MVETICTPGAISRVTSVATGPRKIEMILPLRALRALIFLGTPVKDRSLSGPPASNESQGSRARASAVSQTDRRGRALSAAVALGGEGRQRRCEASRAGIAQRKVGDAMPSTGPLRAGTGKHSVFCANSAMTLARPSSTSLRAWPTSAEVKTSTLSPASIRSRMRPEAPNFVALGPRQFRDSRDIEDVDQTRPRVALHLRDMAPGEAEDLCRPERLPRQVFESLQTEAAGHGHVACHLECDRCRVARGRWWHGQSQA
ncbi:hypothetical protein SRS16CHR_02693 [Variovorax sp. SRS16]|nr:hypothetical protein SRS16CHR_02693 [Variovorax sp. SRS16]